MLLIRYQPIRTIDEARSLIQMAIELELSTLPPYLYALYTIAPDTNALAVARLRSVVFEEMIHLSLACNLHNAIGGAPKLVAPSYPTELPGDIGGSDGKPFLVHLLPFGKDAMAQGMTIEEPEDPLEFPEKRLLAEEAVAPTFQTIGQFYQHLDGFLATLPPAAWHPGRNQLVDNQFFAGELFAIDDYAGAHEAIDRIVSEGEGSRRSPLDFESDLAHYYRFEEIFRDQVLEKAQNPAGYAWGAPLGVDWAGALPAIPDPGTHDFSGDPAAQAAQDSCDEAYSRMLAELDRAIGGEAGRLGNAVRAMFDLRMAAARALATPLTGTDRVAGPAFRDRRAAAGGKS